MIGNPVFQNGQITGPSVYSAATAAKLGLENLVLVSSLGQKVTEDFIKGVGAGVF